MPDIARQDFCLSTTRKWGIAALLTLVAIVPASDIYELLVTGTYDFNAPTKGRRGYSHGSVSLIAWPIALWFYWTMFPLRQHFRKRPLFSLTPDGIETPSGPVADGDVLAIRMRSFHSDALLSTPSKSISFHPNHASGGMEALKARFGDRFDRGFFLK